MRIKRTNKRLSKCLGVASLATTLVLSGCAVSPIAHRTAVFATAATLAAKDTEDAYQLIERSYRDAQIARLVANYDEAGFDPEKIKPFLPEHDLEVRTRILKGLRSYAELLAAVSGDQALTEVDTSAQAVGASLQSLSANDLLASRFTSTDAQLAATAIDALGRALLDRKRRRELPGILHRMQEPIETICALLGQDIGDPAHSGLRNELHISYLDLIRQQTNYIADNGDQLTPSEKRTEIRNLPALAKSESDGDRALAKTQKLLAQLARTHTALAVTSNRKLAPSFHLQMEQLADTAQQLQGFYASLPSPI